MSYFGKWMVSAVAAGCLVALPLIGEEKDDEMMDIEKAPDEQVDQPDEDVAIVVRFYPGGYYRGGYYRDGYWRDRGYHNPYWHNYHYYYWR